MAKTKDERLSAKRQLLLARSALAWDVDQSEALRLLRIGRCQSVRVNTLATGVDTAISQLRKLGWRGAQYAWCPEGLSIDVGLEAVRDSQLASAGQVYIQNAASWLPVLALDPRPNETILDVCAAPGGKTSHIAAAANNQVSITANDNSRPRLSRLRANMQRMGVDHIKYTLFDATQLGRRLDGQLFDKILLDAPCSGEGMLRYDSNADFATWSVAQIKRLQQLQKRLIVQAWRLLKPGGRLVYSTCTIAPEENEAVVDYVLRRYPDAVVQRPAIESELPLAKPLLRWGSRTYDSRVGQTLRVVPDTSLEAFYVAQLQKPS
ncbi:rRNA cytosine-C5-methyltransferase [Candidatus Saccharibacteria bacterium]|nr:MAG: rRNA cytosine-C5-methyltransferase [Candidatus Saccharibacteria bacterium]